MKIVTDGPLRVTNSNPFAMDAVCGYCESRCGLESEAGSTGSGHREHPFNIPPPHTFGDSQRVGQFFPPFTQPLKRSSSAELVPVSWDLALREFTGRIKEIQWRYGKESVAVMVPGQLAVEEFALLRSLTIQGMGMLWGGTDRNPALLSTLRNYQQAFGSFAPPYALEDLEESDAIVLLGTDPVSDHPAMWQRILQNPHAPELIVIDSRSTETARKASQFLRVRPGSEQVLLQGVARWLLDSGHLDEAALQQRLEGWPEFVTSLKNLTVDEVAARTGLEPQQIQLLARTLLEQARVSFWWSIADAHGSQSGMDAAAINLALMLDQPGKAGGGANALLAPCNALGSLLVDMMGERCRDSENSIPVTAELKSFDWKEIREGIKNDQIKGLWVVGTNSSATRIDEHLSSAELDRLEFLVVQDLSGQLISLPMADLCLPAAGWREKTGTLITSERRIHLVSKEQDPPEHVLSDFNIFKLIARYWGCESMFEDWETPEVTFHSLSQASQGLPWDFSGVTYSELLAEPHGIQFPVPLGCRTSCRHRRLYDDGRFATPDGRARLLLEDA